MLLVSVPEACDVVAELVLDVGGLGLAELEGGRLAEARDGAQLGVGEGKAEEGDREAVDEQEGRDVWRVVRGW